MIGEVLDWFLRSLLVFDWRYGDNVSKLLVVVIELGLDADARSDAQLLSAQHVSRQQTG